MEQKTQRKHKKHKISKNVDQILFNNFCKVHDRMRGKISVPCF